MLSLIGEELMCFIGVWMLLLFISYGTSLVTCIGAGFIAIFVTSWSMKGYVNLRPRTLMPFILKKSVLITGCDSGFGASLAERLYELGFKVYAGCLLPLGSGADKLKSKCPEITIVKLDVTNEEDIQAAVNTVQKGVQNGEQFWSLVNNAGIAVMSEFEWLSIDVMKKVHEVNAIGPARMTKAFLPLLRKKKSGRIVIVSSLAGRFVPSGFCCYSMSKFAAIALADCLRMEMKQWGITVHTIEPTLYKTPIADSETMGRNLDENWNNTSEDVKKAYGEAYYQAYKQNLMNHPNEGRPLHLIDEVIDDMVDAVAGAEPKIRYVPASAVRVRAYIIGCLPTKLKDYLMAKARVDVRPKEALPAN